MLLYCAFEVLCYKGRISKYTFMSDIWLWNTLDVSLWQALDVSRSQNIATPQIDRHQLTDLGDSTAFDYLVPTAGVLLLLNTKRTNRVLNSSCGL